MRRVKSLWRKMKTWFIAWRVTGQIEREAHTKASLIVVGKLGVLDHLCDEFGSDKAGEDPSNRFQWPPHKYGEVYEWLLGGYREHVKLVFECGIGTSNVAFGANMGPRGTPGASLRVWREYFPNAEIYGADIDESVLFEEDRITTGILDQLNASSIERYWSAMNRTGFDLMIDDGLHEVEAGRTLFENSISRLKSSGMYVIEDVRRSFVPTYSRMAENFGFSAVFVGFGSERYGHNAADGLMVLRSRGKGDSLTSALSI